MTREELVLGIVADISSAEANLETLRTELEELQADWDLPELEAEYSANVENAERVVEDLEAELADALALEADVTFDVADNSDAIAALGEVEEAGGAIPTAAQEGTTALGDAIGAIGQAVSGSKGSLDSASSLVGKLGDAFKGGADKGSILAAVVGGVVLAVGVGRSVWDRFTASQRESERLTRELTEAFSEQQGAISGITDELEELVDENAADVFDRLALTLAQQNPDDFRSYADALGVLGLTVDDLVPSLVALDENAAGAFEAMATAAGIPAELAAVLGPMIGGVAGADEALQALSNQVGLDAASDVWGQYGDQLGAIADVSDGLKFDLTDLAEAELATMRATDEATAALIDQAQAELGPDASAVEVLELVVDRQNDAAVAAEEYARQQEDAAAGARALSDALGSVDWQAAEIEAANTAFSRYTDDLFAADNAAQAMEEAFSGLETAIGDGALNLDVMTESGRAQQDAVEALARSLDGELAAAYDAADGSQQEFMESATQLRDDVLARLQEDLGLTEDEAIAVADALGLTEGDFQARFELAGDEEARIQLGLLSGAIEGLPEDVETRVNTLILQGDYVAARDEVQAYYDGNPVVQEVDTELGADNAGPDIDAVADESRTATIAADSDTAAAAQDLIDLVSEDRTATIFTRAITEFAGIALDNLAAARTAPVNADARTGDAEAELDNLARTRTATINVRTVRSGFVGGGGIPLGSVAPAGALGAGATPDGARGALGPLGATTDVATTTTTAPITPTVVNNYTITSSVRAAVIGNRFDVDRQVTRSLQRSVRFMGRRAVLSPGGRV